jgi:RimJ/RimL family protein N-acetyltransferase
MAARWNSPRSLQCQAVKAINPTDDNPASIRVLEKAGFALEARLPWSAIKAGVVKDQLLYGAYRPTLHSPHA